MMGAAPIDGRCQKIRPDLSAFIDGTLPHKRWEQVCYHLAGCQACRDELNELSEICSTLSRQRDATADAPTDSTSRLESIAGEGAAQPLYLSAAADPSHAALPLRRRARQRLVVQSGVAVLTLAVVVMVLAVVIAPSPQVVSKPVETARDQFNLALTAIGVNESVGAVLFAHERGARFAGSSQEAPTEVKEEQALRISASAAAEVLGAKRDAGLNYSGLQRVVFSHEESAFLTADVQVTKVEGEGSSMVVLDAEGERFTSTISPELDEPGLAPPASWSFYQYPTLGTVAGRSTSVLEAREEERVARRWWIDMSTNALLRAEYFDSQGKPTIMAGFESISYESVQLPDDAQQLIALMPVSASGVSGWCPGALECPLTLAGLPLVAYSSGESEHAMLVYSDGFRALTVASAEGRLATDATSGPRRASGHLSVSAWQAGEDVVLVATNGPQALMAQAMGELPREEPYPDSWQDWVRRGLERLLPVQS